jgi:FAD/FMN-containing dehydrogenase
MRELRPIEAPSAVFDHREADNLAAALRKRVQGEVRFDSGSHAIYSMDSSNYRQVPIGVVVPKTARQFGTPILARGGGTSLAEQCCNAGIVST